MKGLIAIVGWEELFSSDWFRGLRRDKWTRGSTGEYAAPPRRGFYAVDLANDAMWGPFDTEVGAVGFIVSIVTRPTQPAGDDGHAARVLH